MLRSPLFPLLAGAALFAGSLSAQTLALYDGVGAMIEFSGPPDAAICGYPAGVPVGFGAGPACGPGLVPLPAGAAALPGGITYDSGTDSFLISDGFVVEMYAAGTGLFVDSWVSPLPVFGLGMDSAAGLVWATDGGGLVYAFGIPPLGTCGGPVPLAVLPFPVPFLGGPLSGVDWDPLSGSLWAVDLFGGVYNFLPGGGVGPVAPFPFPAIPGPCWGAPPPYLRVTCDKGSPFGPGHLYLSDGFVVAPILPGGGPAPPTFAFPGPGGAPCFPTVAPSIGIAYTAHGTPYGFGTDPDGLAPPAIGSLGASTTPGPLFTHTIAGAVPGGVASLFMTFTAGAPGFACPGFPIFGIVSMLSPFAPPPIFLGTVVAGPGGGAALPTPVPAGIGAIGAELFTQWFVFKPAGPSPFQSSDGLEFRISLP